MEENNVETLKSRGLKNLQQAAIAHLQKLDIKNNFDASTDEDRRELLLSLAHVDWVSARKILGKNPQFFEALEPSCHPMFYAAMNPSVKVLQEVVQGMVKSGKTTVPRQQTETSLFRLHDLPMNVAARKGLVDNFCYLMTLSPWNSFALEPLIFSCIEHKSDKICKMVMDACPDLQHFVFLNLARRPDFVNEMFNGTPSALVKFGIDSAYIAESGDDYLGLFAFALYQYKRNTIDETMPFTVERSCMDKTLHARGRIIIDHYAKKSRRLIEGQFKESSLAWFEKTFITYSASGWFDEYQNKSFARQLKKQVLNPVRSYKKVKI